MEDYSTEELQKAESFKTAGNELFKAGKYDEAIKEYTQALTFSINNKSKAIYFSNRAYAEIKQENFGLAIADAEEAIKLDPSYPKAYYRKADANIALNKYSIAKECLRKVVFEFKVNDPDAQEKYKFVIKIQKERAFMAAIERDDATETFNPNEIAVEPSYIGPKLEKDQKITHEWCVKLMDYLKNEKKLHKKYVCLLIQDLVAYYKQQPSFIDITIPNDQEFTVVGDTHGQFFDLLNIFAVNGYPSDVNPYLFNGDFVDRGSFSVEIMVTLLAWSSYSNKCIYMSRGNHEAKNMNKLYGFEGEVLHKYDQRTYELFADLFCKLPLGYILNKKVLVLHGGLPSRDGVKLDELKKIDRFREPPDEGLMTDVLWADPIKENGRQPSKRGISVGFGPDISQKFLDDNNLELLVRSHEMKDNGYEEDHNGRVITLFSAPNYCDQMKNKGAIIRFKGANMKPRFTVIEAVEHPKVPPMAYARSYLPFL